ncbi:MAG: hypothetical protein N2259_00205 [Patescibacteria group bacterium]|nr:hypothetical protein [Patescibacteria group bacterium]
MFLQRGKIKIYLIIFFVIFLFSIFYFLFSNSEIYAFESNSESFEIHGGSMESISGQSTSDTFGFRSAGGQIATGLITNLKRVYSGVLYWLYTRFAPNYEQIHYRWRNDDGSETNATWAADEDTPIYNLPINTIKRLRFEISNEGWTRGGGLSFRLEYAQTSDCPSGSYLAVPVVATTEHWEMADSTYLTDGSATTNITNGLTDENAFFVAGQVKDTSNQTSAITVTSENFTEIEFSLRPTTNAQNAQYCFRLTNAGSTSNFTYTKYPTVTVFTNQPPSVSNVQLNGQNDIILTAGTTTSVSATATVSDPNGYSDIINVQAKIYRSGVSGAQNCTPNDNNCYAVSSCSLSNCSGSSCDVTCTISIWFHADPTDNGSPWRNEYWRAWLKATDSQNQSGENFSPTGSPDVNTLAAIETDISNINYGTVYPDQISNQVAVKVTAIGNTAIDLELSGANLVWGSNIIPVNEQKYSSINNFDYETQGTQLTTTPTCYEMSIQKPTTHPSNQSEYIYWKLKVPIGKPAGNYHGTAYFEVVSESVCP